MSKPARKKAQRNRRSNKDPDTVAGPVDDDTRHLANFLEGAPSWVESEQFRRAMGLLHYITTLRQTLPFDTTFSNDLAGTLGLMRAFRQIRAAWMCASFGFDAEGRALLRSAYESAGLSRVAAKDVGIAEKWIQDGHNFPDSAVRRWIKSQRGGDTSSYHQFYAQYSAWSHPTAMSCLALVDITDHAFVLQHKIEYNETKSRRLVAEIAGLALFTCYAWKTAVVNETVIDPAWRQAVDQLGGEMGVAPVERDWDLESKRHSTMLEKLRIAGELDDTLNRHPRSWHNVRSEE